MQPLARLSLSTHGGEYSRIGPNQRVMDSAAIGVLEGLIEPLAPLALTCDVRQIHPPFFTEFCYLDVLGGLNLHTLSAEITCRMSERANKLPAIGEFPIDKIYDKYKLKRPTKKYQKVAFLAGDNSLNGLDQSALQRLMADESWVIKLHPVSNDDMIRHLGNIFGYHRLINQDESGLSLLYAADEVAAMQTSELYIVARYLGKPVTDLSRYDRAWLSTYHSIIRLFDGTDGDKNTIDRVMTSKLSGHLRVEYSKEHNEMLCKNYFAAAMEERERFRLITNQQLAVEDKTNIDWQ